MLGGYETGGLGGGPEVGRCSSFTGYFGDEEKGEFDIPGGGEGEGVSV